MPAECTGRPPETVFSGSQVRPRWSDKVGRFSSSEFIRTKRQGGLHTVNRRRAFYYAINDIPYLIFRKNRAMIRSMEDAFDVMVQYGKAEEMVGIKDEFRKDGRIDMCKGLADWIAEEREAGMEAGKEIGLREGDEGKTRRVVINMLSLGMSDEDIQAVAECERTLIDEVRGDRK